MASRVKLECSGLSGEVCADLWINNLIYQRTWGSTKDAALRSMAEVMRAAIPYLEQQLQDYREVLNILEKEGKA